MILALGCAGLLPATASGTPLFGLAATASGDELFELDLSGPLNAIILGTNATVSGVGLTYNGGFYTFDSTANDLQALSLTGGSTVATNVGFDPSSVISSGGLVNYQGTYYLASGADDTGNSNDGSYYQLNTATNSNTVLQSSVPLNTTFIGGTGGYLGLASNGTGTFYTLSADGSSVYSVDPSTGAVTFLFATGLSSGYTGSVAFLYNDPTDLYAILGNFSTPQNQLFDINLNTQSVIDVGNINNLDDGVGDFFPVTGLTSVPEPATEVLVGGALVFLALAGRRRVRKK